jgi:RHS repeat-associated protein
MAGISDKALKTQYAENRYKYLEKSLETKEFSDGRGLEEYDFGARFYDPQIGRFFTKDLLADFMRRWTPYQYAFDDPIRFSDGTGMAPNDSTAKPDPPPSSKTLAAVTVVGHRHHSWLRNAVSWIPVVGGLVDGIDAAAHGHWAKAAFGLGIAVVDVFTLGEGGMAIHAGEELLEHGAEEPAEHEIENAAVKAEEEVAEQAEKNLAENVEKETAENITEEGAKEALPKGFKETKQFGRAHGQKYIKRAITIIQKILMGITLLEAGRSLKRLVTD